MRTLNNRHTCTIQLKFFCLIVKKTLTNLNDIFLTSLERIEYVCLILINVYSNSTVNIRF